MDTSQPFAESWRTNRAYVVDLAFRMLGDIGEAEDIAQEAFTRLARTAPGEVADQRGWLTVVTSRLCLDHLQSARRRREHPDDLTAFVASTPMLSQPTADPADRITLDDEVQFALLVMLQRLGPAERVAFILHDVFSTPFEVIAQTLGRPIGTCRQLARRARHKLEGGAQPEPAETPEHRVVTERFIAACADGDIDALLAVLHPEAWGEAVFVEAVMDPVTTMGSQAVAENLARYYSQGITMVSYMSLGRPAVIAYRGRRVFAVALLTIADGRVRKLEFTVKPFG